MKKSVYLAAVAITMLVGCATPSTETDLSTVEETCGKGCLSGYTRCLNQSTLASFGLDVQCKSSLKLCAQTCKPRKE